MNATIYDKRGYPLLITTDADLEIAKDLYPAWQTIIITENYGGTKAGAPGAAERLVKIIEKGK
jgi:hypothetical protein